MIAGTDDDGISREARPFAQVGRDDDSSLSIHFSFERAREQEPTKLPGVGVAHGQPGHAAGQPFELGLRKDGQACVHPARNERAGVELRAELRGDGDASLVVHRVPVLAGEHFLAAPTLGCG